LQQKKLYIKPQSFETTLQLFQQNEIKTAVSTGQDRCYMNELAAFVSPYIAHLKSRYAEDIHVVLALHCADLVLGDSRLALAAPFLTEIRDAVRNYFSLSLAVPLMVPMLTWMQLDSGLASTMTKWGGDVNNSGKTDVLSNRSNRV